MKNFVPSVLIVLVCLFVNTPVAVTDGTERLGHASIDIAQGTGVVAAGTGMAVSQPGTIHLYVPADVDIKQVLLYWEGQMKTNVAGDPTIVVNDNDVTGRRIGGPSYFFWNAYSSAFRADITHLGLISPGDNTLTVDGLDFSRVANGAGIVVIYDDGSGSWNMDMRDGLDLAYEGFNPPRKGTIPQQFSFFPETFDRTAVMTMLFSSVAGAASGAEELRPSSIEVSVDGTTGKFSDLLHSGDGEEWDTLQISVLIPAGASTLKVQVFSRDDNNTGFHPASLTWLAAFLSIENPNEQGDQGCTPGYWKQTHHFDTWPEPYTPSTAFNSVFDQDAFEGKTLLTVLQQGGGGLNALGRHAVAALLNSANPDVSYDLNESEVISAFNDAFNEKNLMDYEALKNMLQDFNEQGCPLN